MTDSPNRERRKLLLLVALFFLPLALSFILYYSTGWRPAGQSNHGELISPARPLPGDDMASLRGKWVLAYVGDGRCDADCRRALVFARQTRLSLNQDADRVERAFLATGECCDRELLEREHRGIRLFPLAAGADTDALLSLLPAQERSHFLYIIDPLGNLVMRFDTRDNPRDLLSDMKKLLQLSHIG